MSKDKNKSKSKDKDKDKDKDKSLDKKFGDVLHLLEDVLYVVQGMRSVIRLANIISSKSKADDK